MYLGYSLYKYKTINFYFSCIKTRNGLKMIKIENVFYNIYDTKTINRIKDQMVIDKKYEMEYVFI